MAATMKKINVSGYEAFLDTVKKLEHDGAKQVNVYFTGQKDETGKSWCPDCNEAEPFVLKALNEHAVKDSTFLVVDVGARAFWKDMQNPFRKDPNTHLDVIPTLLRWKTPMRLNGEQCAKSSLLQMFFTESDD